MNDIMKIVKSLGELDLLIKGVCEAIKNEKERKCGFLGMLLGTLCAKLLGIMVLYLNNLPKTKDGAYITNLDEYESIGTHWIALCFNADKETYFDSFGV